MNIVITAVLNITFSFQDGIKLYFQAEGGDKRHLCKKMYNWFKRRLTSYKNYLTELFPRCDKPKKIKKHQSKRKRSASQPINLQTTRTPENTSQYNNMLITETQFTGTLDCHVSYHDSTKPAKVRI